MRFISWSRRAPGGCPSSGFGEIPIAWEADGPVKHRKVRISAAMRPCGDSFPQTGALACKVGGLTATDLRKRERLRHYPPGAQGLDAEHRTPHAHRSRLRFAYIEH